MHKTVAVAVLLLGLSACTPQVAYIEADRATFDAIAPAYLGYVRTDGSLSDEQVMRRSRLVDSWRIRIEQAEGK